MQELKFIVSGSKGDPYEVRFVNRGNGNLSAYCNCRAGENGIYCKHRFALMNGETKAISSRNESEIPILASWLPGSDLEAANNEVFEAQKIVDQANRHLRAAKKKLAKSMLD